MIVPRPATSSLVELVGEVGNVRELDACNACGTSPGLDDAALGASSRTTVSGSVIGTIPVSSKTVVVQIVFEPDMAGYSVGSMMMKPASQSGRVAGTTRFAWQATLPRGSRSSRLERVAFPLERSHLLEHGLPGWRRRR